MDLLKKIFTYTMILVGLAIAVVIISAAYLVLVPDGEIFDYHYFAGTTIEVVDDYDLGALDYDKIIINTYGFDVNVYPQDIDVTEVKVSFKTNANTFTKDDTNSYEYIYNYSSDTNTITISTLEPESGITFYNDAIISVGLPEVFDDKTVTIVSHGGNVTVGAEQSVAPGAPAALDFEIDSLFITNTKAQTIIQNTEISTLLQIDNTRGRTEILNNIGGDVILASDIGSFYFGEGDTMFDIAGTLSVDADNPAVEAGNISGEVSFISNSGLLKLEDVSRGIYVDTTSGEIEIATVLEGVSIISDFNTVTIDTVGSESGTQYLADVHTTNGNIVIGNCYFPLAASSERGDITIDNAFEGVGIETTYGDVDITYNEDATATKDDTTLKTITVVSENGNITVSNIKGIANLTIDDGSSATITASFLEINGENHVNAGRRESFIYLPSDAYGLNVYSKNDDVEIFVGDVDKSSWLPADFVTETSRYEIETQVFYDEELPASVYTDDIITITSTMGKINVLAI
jgi:hypothetical protein